jgi:cobalt-zinc-cadmium efflux system outer membrane protein
MRRAGRLRQYIGAALLVVSAGALPAIAQTSNLTLAAAIERALAANRTIAAARLQRPVDVAGIGVASERPNPELAFEAARDTPKYSIGGTLPIELGGKRQARINVATATVAASEAELARVIAEVRNDVRRTYFEVIAADQRAIFADEIRTLVTRARDAAKARVDAGDVPQADLTQASLALANQENEVIAARGDAASSRAELNALLGQPVDTPLTLVDELSGGALLSLQDAVTQATQANTELMALDRRIDTQLAKVNLAKALRTPDASAGTALTVDSQPDFQYGWRLTGTLTLPIFTTHRAAVTVEEAELTRLKGERDALVSRMGGAIAAALARATSAREQVANYQNVILPLALEAERQAQVSYSAGQTGLVALLQALQTARETRQRGLQAAQDFQKALADLEKAMGAPIR